MKRIHWHWTAGAPGVNPKEADSYNFIIAWPDGEVIECVPVKRQVPPLVNGAYAAHTKDANSWAIGIAVDAMADAQERPFSAGEYPITQKQIDALVKLSRDLGRQYGIPVTRQTMLSHAEVQKTLGIRQNAKWDITWLPGMDAPGDAVAVGDTLRAMVRKSASKGDRMPAANLFADDFEPEAVIKTEAPVPVLQLGSRGEAVRAWQTRMHELRYFSGKIDGIYGSRTHGATMEFQADQGLVQDGIVGRQTRTAASKAVPRALREVTKADLAESRTLKAAKEGKAIIAGGATIGAASIAVDTAEQVADVAQRAGSLAHGLLSIGPWPLLAIIVIVAVAFLAWRKFGRVEEVRIEDALTGANDRR